MTSTRPPTRRAAVPVVAALLLLSAGALHPDLVRVVFTSNGFLPHGVCYSWQPGLVWLHVVSDALISVAYFSIPVALVVFARRRKDLPFHWIFLLFGLFIVSCGATHVLAIWTLWTPQYWLDGAVKAITALASVPTAMATVWLIPRALALPSSADLREANARLEREVAERVRAESALREAQATLEERVHRRTLELTAANEALAAANDELQNVTLELRHTHALNSVFIEQTPIGLGLLDRDLRYARVNEALARINGLSAEQHLGRTVSETLPGLPESGVDAQRRVLETGISVINREVTGETLARPGEQRHWNVSYYPVVVDRKIVGVGLLCEETTTRKRLEAERTALLRREQEARAAAEAASTAKDEFLAAVSHELRNPLQSILGWVQALELGATSSDRLPEIVRRIGRSARLQARLIDDLLDASRIVAKNVVLALAPTDLKAVAAQAVDAARAAAETKGVGLSTAFPAEAALLEGDAQRLHQVVANLLSNAVKFTPAGGRVSVELTATFSEWVISVEDTGRGIAPAFLPHAFEPFRQEQKAPGERGLGLGLAIVRHIVELHGGTVFAKSEGPGRGARFEVRLPRTPMIGPHAAMPSAALARLDGARVLIVDDEEDPREAIGVLLRSAGAMVTVADSVDSAIAIACASDLDLVVTDLAMPDRDGFDLLAALRELDATRGLPIVALSAFAGPEAIERSLSAGFDRHVPKPIDAVAFTETLAGLLRVEGGRSK